jgi:hypothetical protein
VRCLRITGRDKALENRQPHHETAHQKKKDQAFPPGKVPADTVCFPVQNPALTNPSLPARCEIHDQALYHQSRERHLQPYVAIIQAEIISRENSAEYRIAGLAHQG